MVPLTTVFKWSLVVKINAGLSTGIITLLIIKRRPDDPDSLSLDLNHNYYIHLPLHTEKSIIGSYSVPFYT